MVLIFEGYYLDLLRAGKRLERFMCFIGIRPFELYDCLDMLKTRRKQRGRINGTVNPPLSFADPVRRLKTKNYLHSAVEIKGDYVAVTKSEIVTSQ